MKKVLAVIKVTFLALLLLTSFGNQNCLADTIDVLDGSGLSILLIDGNDGDSEVTFTIIDKGISGDVNYRINGGDWNDITWSGGTAEYTYDGGDTLDFQLIIDSTEYESCDDADAMIEYSGSIDASYAQNPTRTDPFYRAVVVDWYPGLGNYKLEILTTPAVHDGFAPVPIPTSVLLLGSGLLGVIGIGFRRRKSSAP